MSRKTVPPRFTIYKARDGWRWHLQCRGSRKIIAESGEAYVRCSECKAAVMRVIAQCASYELQITEKPEGGKPARKVSPHVRRIESVTGL